MRSVDQYKKDYHKTVKTGGMFNDPPPPRYEQYANFGEAPLAGKQAFLFGSPRRLERSTSLGSPNVAMYECIY